MARMKSMRIATVNWCVHFEDANGSYYDYRARMWSEDEETHKKIERELINKGWNLVETQNKDFSILEKDWYIIIISKLWGEMNG